MKRSTPLPRVLILALALAIVGMVNLRFPFSGDQALFTIGAKALSHGAVLYRDFWDLKQPGIYWFYHTAGAIFGYNEIGIHLAEVIWFTALAIVISITLRKRFCISWTSELCAVFTVGVYFAICGSWHLTQLEGLVSLPLYLALLAIQSDAPGARKLIAFGALVSIVALFKLLLIAIPITFFIIAYVPLRRNKMPAAVKKLLHACVLVAIGSAIILLPVVIYFAAEHQLPLICKTFFIDPPRIAAELPMSGIKVLRRSIRWFVLAAGPLLPLAMIGMGNRLGKNRNRFTTSIIAWVVVATLLVLIQRMWWEYHFLLILFPLGLLATFGFEDLVMWSQRQTAWNRNQLMVVMLVLSIIPFAFRLGIKAIHELKASDPVHFRIQESPAYAAALAESQWLASQPSGQIYVLGDPLIYYLSDREQSVSLNGWSPEWMLPEQWDELSTEIEKTHPRYIFLSEESADLRSHRGQAFQRVVTQNYGAINNDTAGTWYAHR